MHQFLLKLKFFLLFLIDNFVQILLVLVEVEPTYPAAAQHTHQTSPATLNQIFPATQNQTYPVIANQI